MNIVPIVVFAGKERKEDMLGHVGQPSQLRFPSDPSSIFSEKYVNILLNTRRAKVLVLCRCSYRVRVGVEVRP